MSLNAKTLFITGASRGIGREIALRAARDGANVVIAAKSAEPHPKLAGTIFSVAEEVEAAGGKALALQLDVRDENAVREAMARGYAEPDRLHVRSRRAHLLHGLGEDVERLLPVGSPPGPVDPVMNHHFLVDDTSQKLGPARVDADHAPRRHGR